MVMWGLYAAVKIRELGFVSEGRESLGFLEVLKIREGNKPLKDLSFFNLF